MAYPPYQDRLDRFLDDYKDQFQRSLVAGGGVTKSQEATFAGTPMSKEQANLEKIKLQNAALESRDRLVHPDTMKTFFGERPIPGGGMSTPEIRGVSATGPPMNTFLSGAQNLVGSGYKTMIQPWVDRYQEYIGKPFVENIAKPIYEGVIDYATGRPSRPIEMQRNAAGTYVPAVGGYPSEGEPTISPPPVGVPIPGGETFLQYTKPDGSIGFADREEAIPSGSSNIQRRNFADIGQGAFSTGGSAIPPSIAEGVPIPMTGGGTPQLGPRTYYEAHPEERAMDLETVRLKPFVDAQRKARETLENMSQGFGLGFNPKTRMAAAMANLEGTEKALAGAMGMPGYPKLYGEGLQFGPGSPASREIAVRQQEADTHRTKTMLEAAGMPAEIALKTAQAIHLQQPIPYPAGSSYINKAGAWTTAPMPQEKTNPLIGNMMTDVRKQRETAIVSGQPFDFHAAVRENLKVLRPMLSKDEWAQFPMEFKKEPKDQWIAKFSATLKAKKIKSTPEELELAYSKYLEQ